MLLAPWSRLACRGLVAGALALMAWGCAPVTFESLATRCVRESHLRRSNRKVQCLNDLRLSLARVAEFGRYTNGR